MKSTYQIWRHHNLIFTGTFEECKAFLIKNDSENDYTNCIRALVNQFGDDDIYKSLQGTLWCTEYASIKPTYETQNVIDELNIKAQMELNDQLLTWGE